MEQKEQKRGLFNVTTDEKLVIVEHISYEMPRLNITFFGQL